jgi:hypothetical protein
LLLDNNARASIGVVCCVTSSPHFTPLHSLQLTSTTGYWAVHLIIYRDREREIERERERERERNKNREIYSYR